MPKTDIIATLGPASASTAMIRKMMRFGLDVVRLNFSHGNHREHAARIHAVRQLNKKCHRRIKILQDLEGLRVRIGHLSKPLTLKKKDIVYLSNDEHQKRKHVIPFDYTGSLSDFKSGQNIFIDDGTIRLRIVARRKQILKCYVEIGGVLQSRKGMNVPQTRLSFHGLSQKDERDIEFGIAHRVDFIAQSFVRTKKDVQSIRDCVGSRFPRCKIIAKIENKEGIRNIEDIISVSDGIMIARGDMGVSIPIYEIAIVQKEIIRMCNRKKKFVITATQMLESMTTHNRPTRAEVTDVSNAILDGTNYVMLSGETAIGKFPSETVQMMNEIIKFTEKSHLYSKR